MRDWLLQILTEPAGGSRLSFGEVAERHGDEILSGTLRGTTGNYPIRNGIPRFDTAVDAGQAQTQESFGFKWTNREGFGSEAMQEKVSSWILERYGFASGDAMREYFSKRKRILDAGCGAGLATSTWLTRGWQQVENEFVGADISAAIDTARQRLGEIEGTSFVQADILALPFEPESFDLIFSEGVLHHTPSTEAAFKSLVQLLRPQGEIMIYVYRVKAPAREYIDDYIRSQIADLPPREAWELLRPVTRLGQVLAELETEVDVPVDVPLLGISKGTYDIQRLIYWHFAKLFWNPTMTFEENNHVNFDWYHPRYAHRHTEDDVRRWFAGCGLKIVRFNVQEAGFTVRGIRH